METQLWPSNAAQRYITAMLVLVGLDAQTCRTDRNTLLLILRTTDAFASTGLPLSTMAISYIYFYFLMSFNHFYSGISQNNIRSVPVLNTHIYTHIHTYDYKNSSPRCFSSLMMHCGPNKAFSC